MVNINKKVIEKIKSIEKDADKVLINADKQVHSIISSAKLEAPRILKESQEKIDEENSRHIEEAKESSVQENKEIIGKGIEKIKVEETKVKSRIEQGADIALDLFIKKIKEMKI